MIMLKSCYISSFGILNMGIAITNYLQYNSSLQL